MQDVVFRISMAVTSRCKETLLVPLMVAFESINYQISQFSVQKRKFQDWRFLHVEHWPKEVMCFLVLFAPHQRKFGTK